MNPLVSLDVHDRTVVVVGAGAVGTRRARSFIAGGARVVVIAPQVSDDIASMASHGDLEWRERTAAASDVDDAWFVVAATDNPTVNADVAAWCEQRRVWCVNASDAGGSRARISAQAHHGDVTLGVVSTGEADPLRAVRIRDDLSRHIDQGDVDLRRVRSHTGTVTLVGSGPGADDLITVRGLRALSQADVVIVDRLGATGLVERLSPDVVVINVGKSPDNHPVPQEQINAMLVEHARSGNAVVRLKGGDPFLLGRGGEEVNACVAAGVPVEVVPGVTSALAVPALAGIPVTCRGFATAVHITSGHAGPDTAAVTAMVEGVTVVVLMGVSTLTAYRDAALAAGVRGSLPVAIVENGSTPRERVTTGSLSDISRIADEMAVKPPAVIVFGSVAEPGLLASDVARTSSR